MSHRSVSTRRVGGRAIGRDGLFPHTKAGEDVRWHVQRMRNPRCDRTVTTRGGQSALSQRGVVIAMNQIVGDAGMDAICLPQLFENSSSVKVIGSPRVD